MTMSYKQALLSKFASRQALIAVAGLGYVGLPLAVEFAESGFRVLGLDVQADKVQRINDGRSYIADVPDDRIQKLVEGRYAQRDLRL